MSAVSASPTASVSPAGSDPAPSPTLRHEVTAIAGEACGRLTRLAARVLETPLAALALPDGEDVVFACCVGFPPELPPGSAVPMAATLCRSVIRTGATLVIDDLDAAPAADSPLLARLGARSYVGVPLVAAGSDEILGSFFVLDRVPRHWSVEEVHLLAELAASAVVEIELRREAEARRRAEAALRSAEARFRSLVEQSLTGIYIVQDERVTYANPELSRIFGYSVEEILALPSLYELIAEDMREELRAKVQRRMRGEPVEAPYALRGRRRDGSVVELEIHGAGTEIDGRPALIGTILDVSERRRLEAQLSQSQKMDAVGRLAGGIAHDFNNLLTAIRCNTELLLDALDPADSLHADATEIHKAADRAAALTRQLLAFSRRQVLQPRVLDLNVVIAELARMLERLLGDDVALVLALDEALGTVRADPSQLEQVLVNLAVNARDAMPDGGVLRLATRTVTLTGDAAAGAGVAPGRYVEVSVTDTGVGMPPQVMARVFEPFFTTKEEGKGTGLGLSTAYGIAQQSGGTILVESAPWQGTCFRVLLPSLALAGEAKAPAPRSQGERPAARGGETVLLVEDEGAVADAVHRILERSGYRVLRANGCDDALRIAADRATPLQLVLTDLVMPGMSGRELVGRLRAHRPEARVLFMSGYTNDEVIRRGLLDAGSAFLAKPFTMDGLARKLREVLDA